MSKQDVITAISYLGFVIRRNKFEENQPMVER